MKITKFNQSCLLVETNNKRLLIDPGNIRYTEDLLDEWKNIDYIFITHRHGDHCNTEAINTDYKCDILCMPFNGNGLTMGIIDGVMFAQDINPELLIPVHMEHPLPFMNPDLDKLKSEIEKAGINYRFLNLKETINV